MSPKPPTEQKRFVTGFCNPHNDPQSHARCSLYANARCDCECHDDIVAEAVAKLRAAGDQGLLPHAFATLTANLLERSPDDTFAAALLASELGQVVVADG